jgi:threonine dehydrogenase-like Zn-dependent dehydrogenase
MLCAVVGKGSRAALSAVVARAMGAAAVIVCPGLVDRDRDRLLSAPFEALDVLRDETEDPVATRRRLREIAATAGLPPHGLCILEASGSDAGRAYALGILEGGGAAILLDRAQPLGPPAASPPQADLGPGLAMDLPVGPAHGSLSLLDRAAAEGCQILGGGSVHPDLLIELLALCERARIDLRALTRRVSPSEMDEVMAQRRQGTGDLLTLPIVDYGPPGMQPAQDPVAVAAQP